MNKINMQYMKCNNCETVEIYEISIIKLDHQNHYEYEINHGEQIYSQ